MRVMCGRKDTLKHCGRANGYAGPRRKDDRILKSALNLEISGKWKRKKPGNLEKPGKIKLNRRQRRLV